MSRTSLRAVSALAVSCLSTALVAGCLDTETADTTDLKDPEVLLAVASSPELALPPKPALAQLATADSATQKRFVDAALGADVSDVFTSVVGLSLSPASTCPAVGRRGDRIYAAADCTDAAGVHWSGNFRAQTWSDTRPMTIELERWSMDAPGTKNDRAWDGTVTVDPNGRFTANLAVYKDGRVSRTVATWEANDGRVVADLDSYVLVQEHGLAQIGGAWRMPRDERATGALFLTGAQELTVDFDGISADTPHCAPVYADGESLGSRCDLLDLVTHLTAFELF
ncbi:MAG TPA: hypothetical protein VM261_26615 [Kofleriaceae bacterium]|nr:hypothetical protein [Kofleriaceae bacterium]